MPAAPGVTTGQPEAFRWDGGYGHTKDQIAQLKLCKLLFKLKFKSAGQMGFFEPLGYGRAELVTPRPSLFTRIINRVGGAR